MKDFFVYGGCVSRDIFNPEYNNGSIKLACYIARSSLARITAPSSSKSADKTALKSPFQIKLLNNDLKNNLFKFIEKTNFDYFLMDFMFLKYRLVSFDGTWLTYSSELKKSGLISSKNQMISVDDELFWDKFEAGMLALVALLRAQGKLDKVFINKLFLATQDSNGIELDNQEYIKKQNNYLERAYAMAEQKFGGNKMITYDPELFLADPNHKWGYDPMHYTSEFYKASYAKISSL